MPGRAWLRPAAQDDSRGGSAAAGRDQVQVDLLEGTACGSKLDDQASRGRAPRRESRDQRRGGRSAVETIASVVAVRRNRETGPPDDECFLESGTFGLVEKSVEAETD